ncbi:Phosphatidylinositol 4-phosphate 5-kinase 1 [Apostasia shenzhenica]|uniref:Phosphatidylinositol 4-phosphate 5-kinase n=1 Tax=Apostasia shenzhenica TaxID=1088818 RepID=A0A2I0B7K3_9ASPA|nr:Phosphatidylinositol 4-phosphate 5-kinase 1 [Apostasia shenzhenica]
MSNGEIERYGEVAFPNGDTYVGYFDGPLPQGHGKYTWSDGTEYEGGWEKGKMSGKGFMIWPSGATYEGEFSGGFLHGSGTFTALDGSVYDGNWRMNMQHGLGTKSYPQLDVYEGVWKEGLQEGIGKYTWNAGNTYVGKWKAGRMNGRGVMKWSNGDFFNGHWLDGLEHGLGYYYYADGSCYFGTWSRGLKDGRGTLYPVGTRLPHHLKFLESDFSNEWSWNLFSSAIIKSKRCKIKEFAAKISGASMHTISNLFWRSRRISHRPTSSDGLCDFGDSCRSIPLSDSPAMLASSSGEVLSECEIDSIVVYEREYMQGVLKMERAVSRESMKPEINKRHQKLQKNPVGGRGETIYKGHKSYYLMLNLQLGIRYTVGKITPVPVREVRSSDFGPRARIKMYFPHKGSQFTPPHYSVDFHWKDYCPMVFRNLREMFKIDAADYMVSVCGSDCLKELSSPGKSGSIFYLSQDERFVIKTLRKNELKILLKMLPRYYDHVGAHDNTLITKFFGLHRITLKWGQKVRFVVMGNMFCTELRIHRRYDLKGSSQGRSTSPDKINENSTLKDLDLSYVFHLEKSWRESLFRQISLDCRFLESQCIIDYSMLLGLHFRAPEYLKPPVEFESTSDSLNSETFEFGAAKQEEIIIHPTGLLLVAHEPDSVSSMPGSHIRGSTLRASAAGDEEREVDLLLPGTGRLRVQLGVNMPAQANRKLLQNEGLDSTEVDLFEVYDVVLYLGIIDILQEYNISKKIEHTCKSFKYDPFTISAVEPNLYSKRFISFLEKVFPEQI